MPDQPETRQTALTAEAAAAEGLTSQEAAERLQRSGPNTVAEEAPPYKTLLANDSVNRMEITQPFDLADKGAIPSA